jgi:regulator of PEP synthase PpsR (kinase-PPPase family)
MAKRNASTIVLVSDGRGQTCRQLAKAALLQFEGQGYRLLSRSNVRTASAVRQAVEKAAQQHAIILYTLVGDETRRTMNETSRELLVPTVDVLGPLFSALHDLFKRAPSGTPGLLYASERENFDRHEAIDYTLKHDDGQRPHELGQADVVLVGVSRASKSSTCFYLAYEGIKAANVPLVPGIEPAPQLLKLDPARVIGLRVNVMRLMTVRETRAVNIGLRNLEDYLDKRAIGREVAEAHRLMDKHGWRNFDASYMAIEEIAKAVVKLRGLKLRGAR